ncbi:MAG: DHA2 family efflux MFS transporter permease subunit [Chlorobiales bacterium]|nr:DHA2 family efflux MFS transporter permease subunit [Chlorobiales bacterium]
MALVKAATASPRITTYETGWRKVIITITVITATLIEIIDTTIVNVALNQISGNLGATIEDVSWVVTSYAIANVIIIPMTSFLGSLLGRRKYYIGSIIIFTIASLLCGTSNNIWELVFFRFIQGLGGGALLSTSQAILFETYRPEERGLATALFGLGVIMGPTLGPVLGGWLVDNYSWHWCFFVNLPIGIFAASLSYLFIKEPIDKRHITKIDWAGIAFLAIGVGSLQFILERGEAKDWFETSYITYFTITAIVCIVAFVWWEFRTDEPVVDLHVMTKSSTLALAATMTFVIGYGLFGTLFIFPVFVQRLLGFTALQTGLILFPSALTTAIFIPFVGKMVQKGVSPKPLIFIGFSSFAFFCFDLAQETLQSGSGDFFWPLIVRGFGLAFIFTPTTLLAVSGLSGKDIGQATALNNMIRQLGGAFGIAITNTFITNRLASHRNSLVSNITFYDTATQERLNAIRSSLMSNGSSYIDAQQKAYGVLEGIVVKQSYHLAYMDAFTLMGILFLICLIVVTFVKFKKGHSAVAPDAH